MLYQTYKNSFMYNLFECKSMHFTLKLQFKNVSMRRFRSSISFLNVKLVKKNNDTTSIRNISTINWFAVSDIQMLCVILQKRNPNKLWKKHI